MFAGEEVWWLGKCGHEWQQVVGVRTRGCGCPKCSSSRGEKDTASWAESQGFTVIEQWRHPDCRDQHSLPFDLMLYMPVSNTLMEICVIEYDGEQHSNPNTYFNQKSLLSGRGGITYVQHHDNIKTTFCATTHRILIRIPYTITGEEAIGKYIVEKLKENGLEWTLCQNNEEDT